MGTSGTCHVTRFNAGSRVAELFKAQMRAKPGDGEFEKIQAELDVIIARQAKRVPEERHRKRMKALYVEPSASGWSRPCQEFDEEESECFLLDAINDYSITVSRYGGLATFEPELRPISVLIDAWQTRPEMPPLPWPKRNE